MTETQFPYDFPKIRILLKIFVRSSRMSGLFLGWVLRGTVEPDLGFASCSLCPW